MPAQGTDAGQGSLADILLKQGAISQQQYQSLTLEQINTGKPMEAVVEEANLVDEAVLAKARATYYNIPYVNLIEIGASPEALNQFPEQVARRYQAFPFALDKINNTLSVAMVNPLDLAAVAFLGQKSGMQMMPFWAAPGEVMRAIEEKYGQSLSSEVVEALKETGTEEVKTVDLARLGEIIREAPIAKIVSTILDFAMKARASDVHIEPQEQQTRVRYRIDGILHEKLVLPKNVHDAVVSRTKILAGMKIDEKRIPQDGRFNFRSGKEEIDLRVSSLPTVHGEKMVMRLLKKTGGVPTLPELGLRGRALRNLETAILVPHGIILITGPTGSGKTTTLYSILSQINTPRVNIITLEDPVEYQIGGVNQVQVNSQAGLTFASGLRSFLRQDPNIIMVGEVRDEETTELAIQASLTGHLVFSTLHTNSAAGALPRLLDMKAEPFLLASSMTCVVAQRVVRRICEDCKEVYKPTAEVVADIKQILGALYDGFKKEHGEEVKLYKGRSCDKCGDTGYKGRIGIFEVLPVTEKIGRLILERSAASGIEKAAVEEGMVLIKQDGYLKALEGLTTLEEVLRVAQT
ncbi:MAG: Flp pilus assembly complex ATPase component TadA [Candidatus Chisholmbacteria bacterium]|nr:Flp pilus assembly complex ATPase component TadA [Candidatus Chisholmbacteria bacterium]